MSLKPLWKNRAARSQTVSQTVVLSGFKALSFKEIRSQMGEALKRTMPPLAGAVDDPNSNVSALLDAMVEAMSDFLVNKGLGK